jgi:hypothetical protein
MARPAKGPEVELVLAVPKAATTTRATIAPPTMSASVSRLKNVPQVSRWG